MPSSKLTASSLTTSPITPPWKYLRTNQSARWRFSGLPLFPTRCVMAKTFPSRRPTSHPSPNQGNRPRLSRPHPRHMRPHCRSRNSVWPDLTRLQMGPALTIPYTSHSRCSDETTVLSTRLFPTHGAAKRTTARHVVPSSSAPIGTFCYRRRTAGTCCGTCVPAEEFVSFGSMPFVSIRTTRQKEPYKSQTCEASTSSAPGSSYTSVLISWHRQRPALKPGRTLPDTVSTNLTASWVLAFVVGRRL